MGNLGNSQKMGFVATPEGTLVSILHWLEAAAGGFRRLFDPCAGEGQAIVTAAAHLGGAATFGCELSPFRARIAAEVMTRCFAAPYEQLFISKGAFSLVWLNPPYDREGVTGGGRSLEESFLVSGRTPVHDLLVPGGVLVYLIPHSKINETIARCLCGWYRDLNGVLSARRDYADAGNGRQCIIFGIRREKYTPPNGADLRQVMAWREHQRIAAWKEVEVEVEKATAAGIRKVKQKELEPVYEELAHIDEAPPAMVYPVPLQDPSASFRFQYTAQSAEVLLDEARQAAQRLDSDSSWTASIPEMEPATYTPAMTPKVGHITSQVLAGIHGTNIVVNETGAPLALKGFLVKKTTRRVQEDDSEEDREKRARSIATVTESESFESFFSVLDSRGHLRSVSDPLEIGRMMETYIPQLASAIARRNVPRYDMNPESWEWEVFSSLSKGRLLPGRTEAGLTAFQKHLAVAMGRLLLATRSGFINAEMGSGVRLASCWYEGQPQTATAVYVFRIQQDSPQDPEAIRAGSGGPFCARTAAKGLRAGSCWKPRRQCRQSRSPLISGEAASCAWIWPGDEPSLRHRDHPPD